MDVATFLFIFVIIPFTIFMKSINIIILGLVLLFSSCSESTQDLTISFEDSPRILSESYFQLGTAVNPEGETLFVNDQSLVLNGSNILPVMGEFHYSRYPENEWRNELLKMKSGGINIIATYVFWIHHEELKRKYDWTGQRNLRKFIEI
ncbi:MAG: beta-galactosidase, partial [Selenomonadaceae bacterium]|nr:beta-galactosidase [Selenomonadaceae bacterium]